MIHGDRSGEVRMKRLRSIARPRSESMQSGPHRQANMTRGDGLTRANHHPLDNPHELRRTTLPILLNVDEAADLLPRTTGAGDLRDDRTPAVARRDPCPPASPPARRRFARLAEPEARAITRGVTGDERHQSRPYPKGGGYRKWTSVLSRPTARDTSASASTRRFRRARLSDDGLRPGNACCSKGFSLP